MRQCCRRLNELSPGNFTILTTLVVSSSFSCSCCKRSKIKAAEEKEGAWKELGRRKEGPHSHIVTFSPLAPSPHYCPIELPGTSLYCTETSPWPSDDPRLFLQPSMKYYYWWQGIPVSRVARKPFSQHLGRLGVLISFSASFYARLPRFLPSIILDLGLHLQTSGLIFASPNN